MAPKRKRVQATGHEDSNQSAASKSVKVLPEPSSRPSRWITIEAISDKELLSVFSRLPLCDLQSLEHMCRRFRRIVLGVYSDRRSLSLIQSPQYRDQLEDITRYWYFTDYTTRVSFGEDCYQVTRQVTSIGVQWLGQRFPNVTQLTLYCVDYLSLGRFVELIQLYPTLERVVMFSTGAQQAEYNQPHFWTALYGLHEHLNYLKLPFGFEQHFGGDLLNPLFTPTLKSIFLKANMNLLNNIPEEFEIHVTQCGLMIQRRTPPNIQGFILAEANDDDNREVTLTRCGLYMTESESRAISLANTTFVLRDAIDGMENLTHLDLAIPSNVALLSILATLSQFPRLTHIRFAERRTGQPPISLFFSELSRRNYRTKLARPNQTLPSIRYLHLSRFGITQSSGIFLYLSLIFPQIDTLHLDDCPMTNSPGKRTFPKWFLNSVQRFVRLRQVYHNYRLMFEMDRDGVRDKVQVDKLIQLIGQEMLNTRL